MATSVFFDANHFKHPFTTQASDNQGYKELSTTEKAVSIASSVLPFVLFPSLTGAIVGITAFYAVTAYFKSSKIDTASKKYFNPAQAALANWLQKSVDTASTFLTIGDNSSCNHSWKEPAILSFGTYDRLDGYRPDQHRRMERHGHCSKANYLSNYFPHSMTIDGVTYKSVEHYYQAAKFSHGSSAFKQIIQAASADDARRIARQHPGNVGNDQEMARRMKHALWAKFTDAQGKPNHLGKELLATGNQLLIEGNDRGANSDRRWGAQIDFSKMPTITLTGQNLLGKLLMELRTILAQH